jgi:uncharacterized membrane protein YidH (DUF202 family)
MADTTSVETVHECADSSWTSISEFIIRDLGESAAGYSWMHMTQARTYLFWHRTIGGVAFALAFINTSGLLTTINLVDSKFIQIVAAIISAISGGLTVALLYLQWNIEARRHRTASAEFSSIFQSVRTQLGLPRKYRDGANKYISFTAARYTTALGIAPILGAKVLQKYKEECTKSGKPRLYNVVTGLQNIEIVVQEDDATSIVTAGLPATSIVAAGLPATSIVAAGLPATPVAAAQEAPLEVRHAITEQSAPPETIGSLSRMPTRGDFRDTTVQAQSEYFTRTGVAPDRDAIIPMPITGLASPPTRRVNFADQTVAEMISTAATGVQPQAMHSHSVHSTHSTRPSIRLRVLVGGAASRANNGNRALEYELQRYLQSDGEVVARPTI